MPVDLIEIGADRGPHEGEKLAQDAILVEAVDGVERGFRIGRNRQIARRHDAHATSETIPVHHRDVRRGRSGGSYEPQVAPRRRPVQAGVGRHHPGPWPIQDSGDLEGESLARPDR